MKKLKLFINTYNRPDALNKTLERLFLTDFVNVKNTEVIVINNHSNFFLKEKSTDKFLSLSPKDNLLFLHPINCRTHLFIKWTCEDGQLKLRNSGKIIQFNTKAAFEASDHMEDLTIAPETELLPIASNLTLLSSTSVSFDNDNMQFLIDGNKYFLKAQEFPTPSYLKKMDSVGDDSAYKISIERPCN